VYKAVLNRPAVVADAPAPILIKAVHVFEGDEHTIDLRPAMQLTAKPTASAAPASESAPVDVSTEILRKVYADLMGSEQAIRYIPRGVAFQDVVHKWFRTPLSELGIHSQPTTGKLLDATFACFRDMTRQLKVARSAVDGDEEADVGSRPHVSDSDPTHAEPEAVVSTDASAHGSTAAAAVYEHEDTSEMDKFYDDGDVVQALPQDVELKPGMCLVSHPGCFTAEFHRTVTLLVERNQPGGSGSAQDVAWRGITLNRLLPRKTIGEVLNHQGRTLPPETWQEGYRIHPFEMLRHITPFLGLPLRRGGPVPQRLQFLHAPPWKSTLPGAAASAATARSDGATSTSNSNADHSASLTTDSKAPKRKGTGKSAKTLSTEASANVAAVGAGPGAKLKDARRVMPSLYFGDDPDLERLMDYVKRVAPTDSDVALSPDDLASRSAPEQATPVDEAKYGRLALFLNECTWVEGQLENEMRLGLWFPVQIPGHVVPVHFHNELAADAFWVRTMEGMGGDFAEMSAISPYASADDFVDSNESDDN